MNLENEVDFGLVVDTVLNVSSTTKDGSRSISTFLNNPGWWPGYQDETHFWLSDGQELQLDCDYSSLTISHDCQITMTRS